MHDENPHRNQTRAKGIALSHCVSGTDYRRLRSCAEPGFGATPLSRRCHHHLRPPFDACVHCAAVAEILLFHHAQGLTPGIRVFADELRAAGHTVHTPDLYDEKTFASLDEGIKYAKEIGFGTISERGEAAAAGLPAALVYAGFSLGVMPAQQLAQTRPGAKGALLFSAAFPASEFGGSWPQGVPLQIHMMEEDEWAAEDLPAARELVESVDGADLFLYPGDRHLFADNSLADYEPQAAGQLKERVLAFLKNVD